MALRVIDTIGSEIKKTLFFTILGAAIGSYYTYHTLHDYFEQRSYQQFEQQISESLEKILGETYERHTIRKDN